VRDLVVHLGNTHAWAATIVETGRPAADPVDEPSSETARGVSAWYLAKAENLHRVLQDAPPDRPCWNFASGDGVAAFWPRRQLHETTIHLVDLEGTAPDLSREVAADGVDEVLTVMVPRMHRRGSPAALSAPVQVLATDTRDSWVLRPSPRDAADLPPTVERSGSGVADVGDLVEAPADVLYRALWHREAGALGISGDQARVRAFLGSRLTP
jgi:uncharacterized protein (TIGR03083 family)